MSAAYSVFPKLNTSRPAITKKDLLRLPAQYKSVENKPGGGMLHEEMDRDIERCQPSKEEQEEHCQNPAK